MMVNSASSCLTDLLSPDKKNASPSVRIQMVFCFCAYRNKGNVEDAVLLLFNSPLTHFELPKSFVRTLFIDFSSAFNSIRPHVMVKKFLDVNVNVNIVYWIVEVLTNRPQHDRLNDVPSDVLLINTGSPQG